MIKDYHKRLKTEFYSKSCQQAFDELISSNSLFESYNDIQKLTDLISIQSKNYDHQNDVLKSILEHYQNNTKLFPLISLVFWDALIGLYRRWKWQWPNNDNPEELFQIIQTSFLEVINSYRPKPPYQKIAVNIFLNTKNKVYRWRGKLMRQKAKLIKLNEDISYKAPVSVTVAGLEIPADEIEEYLIDKVYRQVITKTQYDILIETVVYKRLSLKEWSDFNNTSPGQTRSLKKRALTYLQRFESEKKYRKK